MITTSPRFMARDGVSQPPFYRAGGRGKSQAGHAQQFRRLVDLGQVAAAQTLHRPCFGFQ